MRIMVLAGEESGALYAERLKERLRSAAGEDVEFAGYGTEGFRVEDLAVMGFWPVLRRLPYFLRVARTMKRAISRWRPDAVVTIDYPGLNLKLAGYAKAHGIPAVHVVCPQVWAWHQGRIPRIAASLTKLLCFFPFEPALFAGTGLDAKFIGHPMVDVFAEYAPQGAGEGRNERILALLPGSRLGEIRRNMPRLLKALEILRARRPAMALRAVAPAANERAEAEMRRIAREAGAGCEVRLGGARELLRGAECAAVASGTATLEAALAGCPTVLVYAVSPLLAWFARRVITGVRHIGLANVIWEKSGGGGEAPMPELLQEDFTPEAVADRLGEWLDDPSARAAAVRRLDAAMRLLRSGGDALGLAAREILSSAGK